MKDKGLFMTAALLVCCYGLVSCYNEIDNQFNENPQSEVSTSPYHITITQALDKMFATMDVLSPTTRADEKTIRNIQTVTSADILPQTRSIDGAEATDAYYIVNFENNEGFAILAADARLGCDVIAMAENGTFSYASNFSSRSIESSQNDSPEYRSSSDSLSFEDLYVPEDDDYLLGGADPDDLIGPIVEEWYTEKRKEFEGGRVPYTPPTPPTYTYRTNVRKENNIEPLLTTKWNQWEPFCDLCPYRYYYYSTLIGDTLNVKHERDYDISKINNFLFARPIAAGCIAIAVEQILAYHEYPSTQSILSVNDDAISSWANLKSIDVYSAPNNIKNHIARITRTIGNGCNMWYGWFGGTESFATPNAAKRYLTQLGYTNTCRYLDYDIEVVCDMLENNCPIMIGALSSNLKKRAGHAWLVDGYYKLITENICEDESGNVISKYVVCENDYVHCNWGWKGRCDGWFLSGLFKTSSPLEYDNPDALDTPENNRFNNMDYNYDIFYRMVTYDNPN